MAFQESRASEILRQRDIDLTVQLHAGSSDATFWTCDLTTEYIHINADYRHLRRWRGIGTPIGHGRTVSNRSPRFRAGTDHTAGGNRSIPAGLTPCSSLENGAPPRTTVPGNPRQS